MKKLTKSHTTFLETKEIQNILNFLQKCDSVKSFTAGFIVVKKGMTKTVAKPKIKVTDNSILIQVNSKRAKQEIRVFGNDLDQVSKQLMCKIGLI